MQTEFLHAPGFLMLCFYVGFPLRVNKIWFLFEKYDLPEMLQV